MNRRNFLGLPFLGILPLKEKKKVGKNFYGFVFYRSGVCGGVNFFDEDDIDKLILSQRNFRHKKIAEGFDRVECYVIGRDQVFEKGLRVKAQNELNDLATKFFRELGGDFGEWSIGLFFDGTKRFV